MSSRRPTLPESEDYSKLPRTIIISIINFIQFKCAEYHSEYQVLEVKRHTALTDKLGIIFFELPKLPDVVAADDEQKLWLALFKANTKEELARIEAMGVPVMKEAVSAYNTVVVSPEFKEAARLRSKARHDEAQALRNAELKGEAKGEARGEAKGKAEGKKAERKKWQVVVAKKDAALADKDAALADKDAALADKDAEIALLRAQLKSKTTGAKKA